MSMNQVASDLYQALTESDERKPKPYDTKAEVLRTEGNIVWVKIPGGVDETPVQKTNNANDGDQVMVRIAGGRAWLLGNETSPATDNTVANAATQLAEGAGNLAKTAADSAIEAQQNAQIAYNYADQAHDAALIAQGEAETAHDEAVLATQYANNALAGLSTVESVVDVVNWFANHKTASTDTTVVTGKTYYIYNPVTGTLSEVVPTGTENPSQEGWYELNEAISNYVASHIAQTADGLYVVGLSNGWKVLVSSGAGDYTPGIFLIDPTGGIAQATTASGITFNQDKAFYIGDNDASIIFDGNGHITITGSGVTFGSQSMSTVLSELNSSIKSIEYGKGSSATSHSDISSWSTATPTWEEGKYIWMRTTTNGLTYTYTCIQGAKGEDGDPGTPVTVSEIKYAVSTTDSQPADSSFTYSSVPTVPEDNWLWTRTTYSDGTKAYSKAKQGKTGAAGTSVTVSEIKYAVSTTESQPADSSFTYSSVPTVAEGSWLWTRTLYSDNSKAYSKAKQGEQGPTGAAGTSVTVSSITYAVSTTETQPADSSFTYTSVPTVAEGSWLWTKTEYSDGSKIYTKSKQGKSGTNGTSVTVTKIEYGTSSSASTTPSSWSTTAPTSFTKGTWLWIKTTYSDNSTTTAKNYIGTDGTNGTNGTTFTPSVDANGNISWTNDGGKTNPTTQNIKGPQGADGKMLYATSSTASGVSAKVATLTSGTLTLQAGSLVAVTFTNGNNAELVPSPTLNVSSTGAKAIKSASGEDLTEAELSWIDGACVLFVYDGTYWRFADSGAYYGLSVLTEDVAITVEGDIFYKYTVNGTTYDVWYSERDGAYYYDDNGTSVEVSYEALDRDEDDNLITERKNGINDAIAAIRGEVDQNQIAISNVQGIAENAQDSADAAMNAADDAAKTATNYITPNPSEGMLVHDVGNTATGVKIAGGVSILRNDVKQVVIDLSGMTIYSPDGTKQVAQYGEQTVIGDENDFHVVIDNNELSFYYITIPVAWLNNNQLYIRQSVSVEETSVGTSSAENGAGQWTWRVHKNANGQNNLGLKWNG